jgi:hypothetical protein
MYVVLNQAAFGATVEGLGNSLYEFIQNYQIRIWGVFDGSAH